MHLTTLTSGLSQWTTWHVARWNGWMRPFGGPLKIGDPGCSLVSLVVNPALT